MITIETLQNLLTAEQQELAEINCRLDAQGGGFSSTLANYARVSGRVDLLNELIAVCEEKLSSEGDRLSLAPNHEPPLEATAYERFEGRSDRRD